VGCCCGFRHVVLYVVGLSKVCHEVGLLKGGGGLSSWFSTCCIVCGGVVEGCVVSAKFVCS